MYRHFVKRLLDVLGSLIGIILLALPMMVIAIIVRIDSPGPALFKQERSGLHRKPFYMLKFRTMRTDAPCQVPTNELKDSQKWITKTGAFLRKTSLDELPQLFNIFVGQMSFVGPRPVILDEEDLINERDKYGANDIKPGLTGWAQINGRDELEFHVKAKFDGEYVERLSFAFDCKCLLRTFVSALKAEGVVEGGTVEAQNEEQEKEMVVK